MTTLNSSFTSAGVFPYKIFKNNDVVESLNNGMVRPTHLQVIPTNKCNLSCGFCSCKDRDRRAEVGYGSLCRSLSTMAAMGAKSITITGGGEPLMYPDICSLIDYCDTIGIKTGLVTNGLLLERVPGECLSKLTWCRVSFSDERAVDGFEYIIRAAVDSAPDVDWAFSYVVTRNYDRDKLSFIVDLANRLGFTHVRVVSDLIDIDGSEPMARVKESLTVDDSKVIYQPRQEYTRGSNPCYISLLKPVLGADGYIYPCCGAQYAIDGERLDLVSQMRMGVIEEFPGLVFDQMFFDGSICDRCYYSGYNEALGEMLSDVKHIEFV